MDLCIKDRLNIKNRTDIGSCCLFMKNKKTKGDIAENIAVSYLLENNYEILERNFREPYGEIDIVAFKDEVFRFVEVKSSFVKRGSLKSGYLEMFSPQDRVNRKKIETIAKTAVSYLERKGKEDRPWCIDTVGLYFSNEGDLLKTELVENVVLC